MNKTLRHIILSALLLLSMAVMAQKANQSVVVHGNVFGGGNKAPVSGKSTVLINQKNDSIAGDVYGGGALANVGTNPEDSTQVTILKGVVNGNIYGGGLGDSIGNGYFSQFGNENSVAALVYGKVFVNIGTVVFDGTQYDTIGDATLHGSVFGCNNVYGTPLDSVFVNVFRTKHIENINDYPTGINDLTALANLFPKNHADSLAYPQKFAIAAVYGGGNKASYTPLNTGGTTRCTTVHVYDCQENTIHTIYGGGNAANVGSEAISANTQLIIEGGRYDRVFGGGNGYSADHNHNKAFKDENGECTNQVTNAPCDDYNPGANIFGKAITDVQGGLYRQIFGGSNQFGNITTVALTIEEQNCDLLIHESFGGANEADIHGDVATTLECGDIQIGSFYGGSNLADIIDGSVTLTVKGGTYKNVFGGSKGIADTPGNPGSGTSADIDGNVTLNLCGGTISSAFGGSDANGKIKGIITVNLLDTVSHCHLQIDTIYGGGRQAEYAPDSIYVAGAKVPPVSPVVNLIDGTVGHGTGNNAVAGCVFGGGEGSGAIVKANPKVIIGYNDNHDSCVKVLGNVFGGGNAAAVKGIDTVIYNDNNTESAVVNIFGGGNKAPVDSTVVIINNGTMDTIFGGGNLAGINGTTVVILNNGKVNKGIFGGCNADGNVSDSIYVCINGGQIGTSGNRAYGIFGGGYGDATTTGKDVSVVINTLNTIYADVYGGSALGQVNGNNRPTKVNFKSGTLNGTLYGGGMGDANKAAIVNGSVEVAVSSGSITSGVYGGCNANGTVKGDIAVNIAGNSAITIGSETANNPDGTPATADVYGGGLGAPTKTEGNVTVTLNGASATVWGDVYGGSALGQVNKSDNGQTTVHILSGNVKQRTYSDVAYGGNVFGGGLGETNQADKGKVNGVVTVNIGADNSGTLSGSAIVEGSVFGCNNTNESPQKSVTVNMFGGTVNNNVFGGGNLAAYTQGSPIVNIEGGLVKQNVYGGGNEAGVGLADGTTTTYVNVNGGTIGNETASANTYGIYGGCNTSGTVMGDIEVNIKGGTLGTNTAPAYSLKGIYGGGKGSATETKGDVTVTLGKDGTNPIVYGDVYGGSALGKVNASTTQQTKVDFKKGTINGTIYGGGMGDGSTSALVNGDVEVAVASGTNTSVGVYGGCNVNGTVKGDVKVDINGTVNAVNNTTGVVFGGGLGQQTVVNGSVAVIVGTGSAINGDVYGGSAKGLVNCTLTNNNSYQLTSNSDTTGVTLNTGATINGNLYGGGLGEAPDIKADVYGAVTVLVNGGSVGNVFGSNNVAGTPKDTVNVYVKGGIVQNVFGGGNLSNNTGKGVAVTYNTTSTTSQIDTIFGGGNMAGVERNVKVFMDKGKVNKGIYGGCNTSGTVNGDITVNLNGGAVGATGASNRADVYGGGFGGGDNGTFTNGNVTVTLQNTAEVYGDLYGGSAFGSVNGNTSTTTVNLLNSDKLHGKVFGGGKGQTVSPAYTATTNGNVEVNIEAANTNGYLKGIYGGANVKGNIVGDIDVNIKANVGGSGANLDTIFGGGLGAATTTEGDITVTVDKLNSSSPAPVLYGDVYGGSALGIVGNSSTQDTIKVDFKNGTLHGKIYGGGMGDSSDSTKVLGAVLVEITDGTIDSCIYGGCNYKGGVAGKVTINVKGGTIGSQTNLNLTTPILANVFGGGFGELTTTLGDVEVNIGEFKYNNDNKEIHSDSPTIYGDVYGGSALGTVNLADGNNTTIVNIKNGNLVTNEGTENGFPSYRGGNVFGGGLGEVGAGNASKGQVNGAVTVNIGTGTLANSNPDISEVTNIRGKASIGGNVYGCNNTNGSPQRNVLVNVFQTEHTANDSATYVIPANQPTANNLAYAIQNVFGGGNKADFTANSAYTTAVKIYTCDNTVQRVFGGGNAAATNSIETMIQGGRFAEVYCGGNGEVTPANVNGTAALNIHGGNIGETFGGSNQQGTISQGATVNVDDDGPCDAVVVEEFYCGGKYANYVGNINATITCNQNMQVKNLYGGCKEAHVVPGNGQPGNVHLSVYGGTFENVYGGSKGTENTPANIAGDVTLDIFGGTIDTIFGGSNINGNVFGKITVNVLDLGGSCALTAHNVYGGGRNAAYTPTTPGDYPEVNIFHGAISLKPELDAQGDTIKDSNGNPVYIGGGKVFGGGFGAGAVITSNPNVTIGYVEGMSKPAIASGYSYPSTYTATVDSIVFGGGDLAAVAGSTSVTIQKANSSALSLFGGGNKASVGGATVNVLGGSVTAGVYGGCNENGTVGGPITTHSFNNEGTLLTTTPTYDGTINVNIKSNLGNGTSGTEPLIEGIYGGGKGGGTNGTFTTGTVTVTIGDGTTPVIYSDVYGGSAFGQVGASGKLAKVDLKAGTINGTIYGGGKGSDTYSATVSGNTELAINGSVTGGVYGGCNVNGTVAGGATVGINGGTIGVANNTAGIVFGGGLGQNTVVSGPVALTIGTAGSNSGATINGDVYGGSAKGKVNCTLNNNQYVYTGSGAVTEVTMNVGTITGNLYGGGLGEAGSPGIPADVYGPVTVNVKGGSVNDVFGCNNIKGAPKSTVQVNINNDVAGNVFGGGNEADYTGTPNVNITNGTVSGSVFGGGNKAGVGGGDVAMTGGMVTTGVYGGCNEQGAVAGDITVDITGGTIGASNSNARANVHGGGLGASTTTGGAVTVNIAAENASEGPTIYGDLYGGSGFGQVSATDELTQVNFYKGTINGDIYGGGLGNAGNPAEVSGNVEVNIRGGVFNSATGTAGGGQIFGGNNAKGTPKGNVTVNIYGTDHTTTPVNNTYPSNITNATQLAQNATTQKYAIAAVYGGGNLASYEPVADKSTTVHVYNCNNTIKDVYGGGNAANVGTLDSDPTQSGNQTISTSTNITIDGGRINRVFGGGNGETQEANIYGTATTTINGGLIDQIFGGGNKRGTITGTSLNLAKSGSCTDEVFGEVFGGANEAPIAGEVNTTVNCGVGDIGYMYGGSNLADIGSEDNQTASITLNILGGSYDYVFGGSKGDILNLHNETGHITQAANIYGSTTLNLFGGTIKNAFGGSNINGNITGKIQVNVLDYGHSPCGLVVNNIYGAGNLTAYSPSSSNSTDTPEINLINGSVTKNGNNTGNVYGGARGETNYPATVSASPKVNIGYNATAMQTLLSTITLDPQVYTQYSLPSTFLASVAGSVYGGGENAAATGSTTVIVQNNSTVSEDVYGGGALADVGGSNVTLDNGTGNNTVRRVFGGGMGNSGTAAQVLGTSQVTVTSGKVLGQDFTVGTGTDQITVKGAVFGGCNENGNVSGAIIVNANGGNITGNVYGGGLGALTTTGAGVTVTVNGSTMTNDVYGGSALGQVNTNTDNLTKVNLKSGSITGKLYGGGMGQTGSTNVTKGQVNGNVEVLVEGGSVTDVFGCNNYNGAPLGTVKVDVSGDMTINNVYGGGNLAAYIHADGTYPEVNIKKGTVANVFGGGLGLLAAVTGSPKVTIGSTTPTEVSVTGNVYGGGDLAAVNGSTSVTVQQHALGNTGVTHNVYGGGNQANVSGSTEVSMTGGTVSEDIYGGGALAHVNINEGTTPPSTTTGATTSVSMSGGSVRTVYGGGMGDDANNGAAALVYGNTTVTVSDGVIGGTNINTDANPILGGVFGGCNKRGTVLGGVTVNVKGAVGSESNSKHINVYGGGLGQNTNVVGAVAVGVGADVFGDVYGGSAKGLVNYSNETTPAANSNTTTVTLTDGAVKGDIYGGGHGLDDKEANVGGPVTVAITGGSVNVYGTKGGNVFGCNNVKGSPIDTVNVNITAGIMQNVFGGGNLANKTGKGVAVTYNYNTTSTTSQIDTIFGGGNMAGVAGNAKVIMANGKVNKGIYGGCNASGNIGGKVTVNVNGGTIGSDTLLQAGTPANIHGGGYGKNTSTNGNVLVVFGDSTSSHKDTPVLWGDIYGGSAMGSVNDASSDSTTVNILNGVVHYKTKVTGNSKVKHGGHIYGGGLGVKGESKADIEAIVNGKVFVNVGLKIDQDTIGYAALDSCDVYGCNNAAGSPQDTVFVNVWRSNRTDETQLSSYSNKYAIDQVFGGGNKANYAPADNEEKVITYIHGCGNTIRRLFGGGNAAAVLGDSVMVDGGRYDYIFGGGNGEVSDADIGAGGISLTIMGGKINQFFGGSNQNGSITGELNVNATSGECELDIENFFCGSNQVEILGNVYTTITCNGGMTVTNLYGGSNLADIKDNPDTPETEGNVSLTVEGGTYTNVFGGSKGDLESLNSILNEVGHEDKPADITGNVTLNIFGGTIENAFGGSDVYGNINGKITVNVIDDESSENNVATCPLVLNNVYGGGRDAAYTPTDALALSPYFSPEVNIIHGTVSKKNNSGGNVFGGGLGTTAIVSSNPKVIIGYDNTMTLPSNATTPTAAHAIVAGNVYGGGSAAPVGSGNNLYNTTVLVQKSNSSVSKVFGGGMEAGVTGTTTVTLADGEITSGVYGGCDNSGTVGGDITVSLEGGTVNSDVYGGGFGGGDNGTFTNGNVTVTLQNTAEVNGDLYGGSAFGSVNGNSSKTTVNLQNSNLHGKVFGGGKGQSTGTQQYTATTNGNVELNIEANNVNLQGVYGGANEKGNVVGNIDVNVNANVGKDANNTCDIFGGGLGASTTTGGDVTVTVGNGSETPVIYGDIYGGSALGWVGNGDGQDTAKIDFKKGTLNGTIYGGGMGQSSPSPVAALVKGGVVVDLSNGSVSGGVYGGCNERGTVEGDIQVSVNGGQVGTSHTARANVHGGGYGKATATTGDVEVNIGNGVGGPTIYGDIYGGSGFGDVNSAGDTTMVNVNGGTVYGDIYGGGLGQKNGVNNATSDIEAKVYGKVFVNIGSDNNGSYSGDATISKYTVGAVEHGGNVFGCNNANGSPQDSVFVNIFQTHHGNTPATNAYPTGITTIENLENNIKPTSQGGQGQTFAIDAVYGGGNLAAYTPELASGKPRSATVHVYGCASNTIKELYGGGNAANVGSDAVNANTFIYIDGGRINRVFGGGKGVKGGVSANIYGTATTTIYAGLIDSIFGGSNQNGTINEANLVLATESGNTCSDKLYNQVFGGANVAEISGNLNTTINCGVGTIGDIYGGSNLAHITGTGNVTLNIKGGTYDNVFGGSRGKSGDGNGANISGDVTLNLEGGRVTNAFGGSNVQGNIAGTITVNVEDKGDCSLVVDTIYGGGQDASYTPNNTSVVSPVVNIKKANIGQSLGSTGCVFGGGKGASATVYANPKVIVGHASNAATVFGNVFGGGNLAQVNGIDTVLIQHVDSRVYNVFGGGNEAGVNGNTVVIMDNGTVDTIFGGGNKAGVNTVTNTQGSAKVVVNNGKVKKDIYGGCNVSGTIGSTTTVNLTGGTVEGSVFGGGFGSNTVVTSKATVEISGTDTEVNGDVYGGGNEGVVNGGTDVKIKSAN